MFNTPAGIICGQQFGDARGRAVFYFHGQISSRLEALYFELAAAELGVRLIALDRHGFGRSPGVRDSGAGTRLATWPAAVEAIGNQLGLARFGVIGVSAGVKYALASAVALPARITGAVLASSFGEVSARDSLRGAAFRVKFAVGLYRGAPWLGDAASAFVGLLLRHSAETLLRVGSRVAPATERAVLLDPEVRRTGARVLRSSVSRGTQGMAQEFRCMVAPWDLRLDAIRVPVTLWHGESDVIAPLPMAETLAANIPGSVLHRVPNAGHVSLLIAHPAMILRCLV